MNQVGEFCNGHAPDLIIPDSINLGALFKELICLMVVFRNRSPSPAWAKLYQLVMS